MADDSTGFRAKKRKLNEGSSFKKENVLEDYLQKNTNVSVQPSKFNDENEDIFVDKACKKYKSFATTPKVSSARIVKQNHDESNGKYSILANYSQHDLTNSQMVKYEMFSTVDINWETNSVYIDESAFPSRVSDIVIQSISNDGIFKAIVRKLMKKEKSKFVLEIWSDGLMHKAIDLSSYDVHGDVYNDDTFSCLDWSLDGLKIIYIAEKKKENALCYFEQDTNGCKKDEKEMKNKKLKGEKYHYEEDWGEQKAGLCSPVIVVVDVIDEKIKVLDEVPSFISPGQAIWASNDSIVFVGWWNEPFKLGLVYCHNRRSAIFQLSLNESNVDCKQLSDDGCSVQSPRISPDQSKLVYLERDEGGPHLGCKRLMMYDMKLKTKCSMVYDIVEIASDLEIPLYSLSLIKNCWAKEGDVVVLDTNYKANKIIVMIELETGQLKRLSFEDGCWSLMDVCNNVVLATYSSPTSPDCLMMANISCNKRIHWLPLRKDTPCHLAAMKDNFRWEMLCVPAKDSIQGIIMESILVYPMISSSLYKPPLIVWPHGGPHSCAVASFSSYVMSFAAIGCAVLLVNYRGSTGFGEYPLRGLLGKIGLQDVEDVQEIAEVAVKTGQFDAKNIFAFGGSHGGFLSAHLVSKYPDFYRACALRNPVINLPGMVEATDIPDWCFVESGREYQYSITPSKETYCQMLDKSPLSFAKHVKCPVMLMIGGKDCRVPPYQGKNYYRALKARGKVVKMHWYPEDCHPLSQVETEADVFINVGKWFYTHFEV